MRVYKEKNNRVSQSEKIQSPPGLQKDMINIPDCGEESYVGSSQLEGKKMLVTGGDSGIGRAVAIAYAREGANVAINYLASEEKDVQEVKKIIEKTGRKIILLPGDLEDEQFCQSLVKSATEKLAGLDNITLIAGRQQYQTDITNLSTEELLKTYRVNVFSMFWVIKAGLAILNEGSTITTTSSVQAVNPSPHLLDYASTKGAITTFTKGLAKQLGPKGIRVNSVAPGPIWTVLQVAGGQPKEVIPEFGEDTPLQRPGQPLEMAGVYVFLASKQSSFVTGQIYGVTGGKLS